MWVRLRLPARERLTVGTLVLGIVTMLGVPLPSGGQSADVQLSVDTNPPGALSVVAGQTLSYSIVSFNDGPDTATDVKIYEETPPGSIFESVTPSAGGSCSQVPIGVGFGAEITCTWSGATPLHGARSMMVTVRVCSDTSCGYMLVNDMAKTWSSTFDPLPGNDMQTGYFGLGMVAEVSTPVLTRSVLGVTKSGSAITTRGASATYTIVPRNNGPSSAAVTVTDTLPVGWTVASITVVPPLSSCSGVGTSVASCSAGLSGPAICSPFPSAETITVVANVPPSAPYGTYLNTADIASSNCLADSGNLVDQFETAVRPVAIFSDGFESGSTSAWTLSVP